MKCAWHLCQTDLAGKQTRFCSAKCKNKFFVDQNRRATKLKAVLYKGGCCELCGYSRCIDALIFHHDDPTLKDFAVGKDGYTRSWESVRAELDKCSLLCANCHAEVHAAMRGGTPEGI